MSLRRAFALEAFRRRVVLDGIQDQGDMRPLYDSFSGKVAVSDLSPLVTRDHDVLMVPGLRAALLSPDIAVYRVLFRCFAGAVADLRLPRGAFFTGSAVLAATTVPARLWSSELLEVLHDCDWAEEAPKITARICLRRVLASKNVLVGKVMDYAGPFTAVQEVRSLVANAHLESPFYPMEENDVLQWTDNGYGPYARSDIDIMYWCQTSEEGDRIVRKLHKMLKNVDGHPATVIRTANTITFCRSWPERHVQVVLYTMPKVSSLLLFADLDCTAMATIGGIPFTTSRSRRALELKANLVPALMLENRKDTPKRVAAYVKRGFASVYLQDSNLPDVVAQRTRALQRLVEESLAFEKKLLDLLVFNYDGDLWDDERAATYLAQTNTSYSSTNIPRMAELSAGAIERFFLKLGSSSAASLLHQVDELPRTQDKLDKVATEIWVSWGMA